MGLGNYFANGCSPPISDCPTESTGQEGVIIAVDRDVSNQGPLRMGDASKSVSNPFKPRLRGVSHMFAAVIAAPAAVMLWAGAESFTARLGAATFGASLINLFAISAIYHCPTWPPRMRDLIGRIDQAAIFVLIAGTFTPFGLLLRPEAYSHLLLAVVWGCAFGGLALSLAWPDAPKPLMAGIYVIYGWVFIPFVLSLLPVLGGAALTLIILGGLAYTLGAVVYALKRPNPFPRVFGYHEIFHLFVVAAAALHFAAVSLTLPSLT